MPDQLPVYSLSAFNTHIDRSEFYCNRLKPHLKAHTFTKLPHKHDFYLVVIITKGTGWHEIDFTRYAIRAGTVFIMQPGQMHYWKFSENTDGFVFFHTSAFYNGGLTTSRIEDYAIFKPFTAQPFLKLSPRQLNKLSLWMKEALAEYQSPDAYAMEKWHALVNLMYIELSRSYRVTESTQTHSYRFKLNTYETLIDKQFKEVKLVSTYAGQLNISVKHLNRITKTCLNKTATQLITERVVLEAKRLLVHANANINQVGYALGYTDSSYFIRFFKKHTGTTPKAFVKQQMRH
ncbi:MAG: AraC family transcriptional regulator [Sediminibacterium sp.]|nr:AraC family transcriptional regulator [Sediminibacterium sp.]